MKSLFRNSSRLLYYKNVSNNNKIGTISIKFNKNIKRRMF